jgi:hypothetical protein
VFIDEIGVRFGKMEKWKIEVILPRACQGSEDLAQIAMRGLFPGPLPPRQVADFSVGKLVGFRAAPHHAEITISSASHCATQLATLHVARTT